MMLLFGTKCKGSGKKPYRAYQYRYRAKLAALEVNLVWRKLAREIGAHLLEATDHSLVVLNRVKLDTCLHDIHRAHSTVGDTTADTPGKGTLQVVIQSKRIRGRGHFVST